jgi:hypothetical protein
MRLKSLAVELAVRRNQIFTSLFKTHEKLKKLGFIYHNGKICIHENEGE